MSPQSHSLPQPEGLYLHNRMQAKRSLRKMSQHLRLPERQDFNVASPAFDYVKLTFQAVFIRRRVPQVDDVDDLV
jgi:hypothetical protein